MAVPDPTHITITGADKQAVGQFAAIVREVRPPETYKGKGIRHEGEAVRRKAARLRLKVMTLPEPPGLCLGGGRETPDSSLLEC